MFGTTLGMLLLVPASPVPPPAPMPAASPADRAQAMQFANLIYSTASTVSSYYARPPDLTEYLVGAIRGMYEAAGQTAPDNVLQDVRRATGVSERITLLAEARLRLGHAPALAGPRAYIAAVNGFRLTTDPYFSLVNPGVNRFVSIDIDFGVGIELDGVTGQRWSVYRIERAIAVGQIPPQGIVGSIPKPDAVASPAVFPWRVKRVIPGSPAFRAGVRAGDIITHLNGSEVTAERANRLFAEFAFSITHGIAPQIGQPLSLNWTLKVRRQGKPEPIEIPLETDDYVPETVHGVMRRADGGWDCMLDRQNKIGYVRVGPIEAQADKLLDDILVELQKQGCRALILDLRWCPGGYVIPGCNIAGLFLREGQTIATLDDRSPNINSSFIRPSIYRSGLDPLTYKPRFLNKPLVVLVGSETTGGGELIAAALQDAAMQMDESKRTIWIMGQRTVGRATIQRTYPAGLGDLQVKITTGTTLRPNGKNRQRNPNSKPGDDWGVRPEPGLEVPITLDLSVQLRQWAEAHAVRPADSDEALEFDDPAKDPYRTTALAFLRKKLGRAADMQ